MRLSIIFVLIMMLACQSQNKKLDKAENTPTLSAKVSSTSGSETQQEHLECNDEVCLQLRNHDLVSKSFEIYMLNSIPVAGFQCDFPGINIKGSDGGLLKENGYQTSNSASRILSFSMQATLIPVGEGILTTVFYSDPTEEVCMTEIIFAGMGGEQLSNNAPECMMLN